MEGQQEVMIVYPTVFMLSFSDRGEEGGKTLALGTKRIWIGEFRTMERDIHIGSKAFISMESV